MRYLAYTLLFVNIIFFVLYPAGHPPRNTGSNVDAVPLDAPQLRLLSERVQPLPETDQLTEVNSDLESVAPTYSPYHADCHVIGPLTQGNADRIYEILIKQNYRSNIRTSEVEESAGYRVFLPATSQEEARRTIGDLEVRGMNDYFMGKHNDISLGVFSSRAKAQTQKQKVEQYGYRVELENRYRARVAYWLDVEEGEPPLLESEIWTEIQSIHPNLKSNLVRCE